MKKLNYNQKVQYSSLLAMIVFIILIEIIFYSMGSYFRDKAPFVLLGMLIFFVTSELFTRFFRPRKRDYVNYLQGERGEKQVRKKLNELEPEYIVVNGIKLPWLKSNIDHVVVGNNGIFLIETKNYRGKIICNGGEWYQTISKNGKTFTNYIGNPSGQANWLARELKVYLKQEFSRLNDLWINSVVAFADENTDINIEKPPENCKICKTPQELIDYIKQFKPERYLELDKEELQKLKNTLMKYPS
jgi:hypothetical protein